MRGTGSRGLVAGSELAREGVDGFREASASDGDSATEGTGAEIAAGAAGVSDEATGLAMGFLRFLFISLVTSSSFWNQTNPIRFSDASLTVPTDEMFKPERISFYGRHHVEINIECQCFV